MTAKNEHDHPVIEPSPRTDNNTSSSTAIATGTGGNSTSNSSAGITFDPIINVLPAPINVTNTNVNNNTVITQVQQNNSQAIAQQLDILTGAVNQLLAGPAIAYGTPSQPIPNIYLSSFGANVVAPMSGFNPGTPIPDIFGAFGDPTNATFNIGENRVPDLVDNFGPTDAIHVNTALVGGISQVTRVNLFIDGHALGLGLAISDAAGYLGFVHDAPSNPAPYNDFVRFA